VSLVLRRSIFRAIAHLGVLMTPPLPPLEKRSMVENSFWEKLTPTTRARDEHGITYRWGHVIAASQPLLRLDGSLVKSTLTTDEVEQVTLVGEYGRDDCRRLEQVRPFDIAAV